MSTCEFCKAALPDNAAFCGNCGRTVEVIGHSSETPTSGSGLSVVKLSTADSVDSAQTITAAHWEYAPQHPLNQTYGTQTSPSNTWQPPNDAEEEEEKRRRAALMGMGLVGLVGEMQPPAYGVPMVQGSPQFGGVPFVQGMPGTSSANTMAQGGSPPPFYSSPTMQVQPPYTYGGTPPQPTRPRTPRNPNSPHTQPSGCAPAWLIFLFAIVLIISGIVTIGLTVLAPSLSSLSGNTDIAVGGTLQLHGSSFIPDSSVTLTLDNTLPLFYTDHTNQPAQALHTLNPVMGLSLHTLNPFKTTSSSNVISVGLNGSFTVTIAIDQSWSIGQHTIRAAEKLTPRSATITINIHPAGQAPTPSPSATVTVSPSATVSPTATVSPSATPNGLSCVNPTSVTLGPVSEGYSKAVSTAIALCTAGSGTVNWTATWDTNQDSWLQLDQSSGQIQAPAQQQINVSALAANLKAGNYSATITFSSQGSSSTETLTVSFTVQTGCISTNPQKLSFSGVAGVSDPAAQTVTVSNCGLVGTWATAVATDSTNWLTASPTSGSLDGSATQSVTVTASNLKSQLNTGTYSGSITFSIGTNQVVVSVTLTVQAAPKIIVVSPNNSPPSFDANSQLCSFSQSLNATVCIASISNSSQTLSLSWKSSSTGVPKITFQPASDTLAPGGGERVTIIVPKNDCQTATTLTFTGPANAQNISWSCTLIQ